MNIASPLFRVTLANVLYSLSTFLVTLTLPYLLPSIFQEAIYIIQMVLFVTVSLQSSLHVSLYYFYKVDQEQAMNLYMSLSTIILAALLGLAFWENNPLIQALNIADKTRAEQWTFHFAVICSCIYLYNKAVNLATQSYTRMFVVSLVAIVVRLLFLLLLWSSDVKRLEYVLLGVFILPFVWEFVEYGRQLYIVLKNYLLRKKFVRAFLQYAFQMILISTLSMIANNLFLIRIKELDAEFAAAIAFSMGFMGILTLLYSSCSSYFTAALDKEKPKAIKQYILKLNRFIPVYMVLSTLLSIGFAVFIRYAYSHLGLVYALVALITLLRSAMNTYVGLYTLLSQVLNLLKWEVGLNILRLIMVYALCKYQVFDEFLWWYIVVVIATTFPDWILAKVAILRIKRYD